MESLYHLNFFEEMSFRELDLIQLGRLHCSRETVVKPHLHLDWYELTVATEGNGTVYTGKIPTPISAGDIYLSYPCEQHAILPAGDSPLKYDFFAFRPKDPLLLKNLEQAAEQRPGADMRLIRDERISALVTNAIAELCEQKEDSPSLLNALFFQLTTYLLRDLNTLPKAKAPAHTDAAQALCYRVMHYIDTHLYSLQNLQELAELTGYDYSHLSSLFHKTTGSTLFEYRQAKRLGAAKLLIKEEKRKISEVAELLGYSSAYAFSKAYRKQFSVSSGTDRNS